MPANGEMIAASTKSEKEGGLTFALQALLDRHESYMAESEEERRRMAASIGQLENDNRILEAENARAAHENDELLHQLEGMNTQIADSDAHINSLTATLYSAQSENRKLMTLASRTAELEAQLTAMEIGQSRLQEELVTAQEDQRSAIHRWKHAETRLAYLNDQVLRIEREARDEREKHAEIIRRMEQRRAVESGLENAAGRLKGAAAASTLGRDKCGTNIVSHFVHDILQDNTNLQAALAELRELLQASNEEVQNLRELVLRHQPISGEHALQPASLMDEIEQIRPKAGSQEVHVHHHYHAKIAAKEKRPNTRRPPKRRGLALSSENSSRGCQTPNLSRGPTLLSMPYPSNKVHRWSTQSSATQLSGISSLPSSPYSDRRNSSIFDSIESGFESSRPTSPESAGIAPSRFQLKHQRLLSGPNITELTDVTEDEQPGKDLGRSDMRGYTVSGRREKRRHDKADFKGDNPTKDVAQHATPAVPNHPQPVPGTPTSEHEIDGVHALRSVNALSDVQLKQPRLRRSNSQESLVSISGMDIHLPQQRNTRLCILPRSSLTSEARDPSNLSIAFPSAQPLASIAEVNASFSNVSSPLTSDPLRPISLLTGLAGGKLPQPAAKGFGQLGRWARGRWGLSQMGSTGNLRDQAAFGGSSKRSPGINQDGPIIEWKSLARAPSEVHARLLDEDLLKESLME